MNIINYQRINLDDKYLLLMMILMHSGSKNNALLVSNILGENMHIDGDIQVRVIISDINRAMSILIRKGHISDTDGSIRRKIRIQREFDEMDEDQDPWMLIDSYTKVEFLSMLSDVIDIIKYQVVQERVMILIDASVVRSIYKSITDVKLCNLSDITSSNEEVHLAVYANGKYIDLHTQ